MDQTLWITGASAGIGAACARLAARKGLHLLLHYGANLNGAEAVAREARAKGAQVTLLQADLSDPSSVAEMGQAADKASDPALPLSLINNAGVVDLRAGIADMTPERLTRMFTVNVISAILVAREAVALMRRKTDGGIAGGHIVNLSSTAARLGMGGQYVDYAASKGAIDTFTCGLADELAPEGIRVNAVRPGLIDTEIHAKGGEPDRMERLGPNVPLGRPGSAEEVAQAILWLLSDQASYTTRHILDVSGGR
jgi:glucose 1-dehydrogenase